MRVRESKDERERGNEREGMREREKGNHVHGFSGVFRPKGKTLTEPSEGRREERRGEKGERGEQRKERERRERGEREKRRARMERKSPFFNRFHQLFIFNHCCWV